MVKAAGAKPGHGDHRLYAEIWDPVDKKLLAWGHNSKDDSDLSVAYAKHHEVVGTHAEVAAIVNALSRHVRINGASMFIARAKKLRRGGRYVAGLAQPCDGCKKIIDDFGIMDLIYTFGQKGEFIQTVHVLRGSHGF